MDYKIAVTDCRSEALVRVIITRVGKAAKSAQTDMDNSYVVWNRRKRESWEAARRSAECEARGMKAVLEEFGHAVSVVYATRPLDELISGHGKLNSTGVRSD